MLTPEQVEGLQVAFEQLAQPLNDYLIKDIARRVSQAGQFTSTAAYQIWRMQEMGTARNDIEKAVAAILDKTIPEVQALFQQAAEVGYSFDISHLSREAIPFATNTSMQQIVAAAVELAEQDLRNITQTMGFKAPDGNVSPLLEAYQKTTDFAFTQIIIGAADYNTAIRTACDNLAAGGIRTIDYASGVHTNIEAAMRRNMMGGLGLMAEQISQQNHDDLGCNGWEISAHAASAPDHEPIQGKQYSDEAYKRLNDSLQRRIGTLNCGHNASPIILGVSSPQYTPQELEQFRQDNAKGVAYEGRQFDSVYEATQYQRRIERNIRTQKCRVMVAEATGDKERLTTSKIRLNRLNEEYRRFSKATGLPTQEERLWVSGFGGKKQEIKSRKSVENNAKSVIINTGDAAMEVTIDQFTPCLEEASTGKIVETKFSKADKSVLNGLKGWNFNWQAKDLKDAEIYRLMTDDGETQGLIALTPMDRDRAIYVNLAESAPHNLGKNKKYNGVGGHLFAIAAQRSTELGYGGFFFMDAKNIELVRHYQKALGAVHIGGVHMYRMLVDEDAAQHLLEIYTLKEGQ